MQFSSIKYEFSDLIAILKQNTSLLTNVPENQLFVSFWIYNGKVKSAEVKRIDNKELSVKL